jgi:hypothetical protein
MADNPIAVAETPLFVRQAASVWDDAEREALSSSSRAIQRRAT